MSRVGKIGLLTTVVFAAFVTAATAGGSWKHIMDGQLTSEEMIALYDADGDGQISQAEMDASRALMHAEFDTDKSEGLVLQEYKLLWLKAQNQRMIRDFQNTDRDANGQISVEEFKQPMSGVVAQLDNSGEGVQMGGVSSNLPVYINGYENHYPRTKRYYLSGRAIIVSDPGPSRFYK